MSQAPVALALSGISKVYRTLRGSETLALGPLDLEVYQDEFVSILGPSGCGKSTLLRLVAGLEPISVGNLAWAGGGRQEIGFVFQDAVLLPWKTVLQNVRFPLEVMDKRTSSALANLDQLLELAGLANFKSAYPRELSGGMRQRAAIVRALAYDPAILLMDEPFGALDALTREMMGDELLRIWTAKRKTILFVTHSIEEAVYLSDRVVVLSSRPGRISTVEGIALPRPRTRTVRESVAFAEYTRRLREVLG